jgi:hypothetical protein
MALSFLEGLSMTGLCAVVEGIDSNVLSLTQQGGADALHSMFPILPPVHIYQSPTESYKVLVARLKATGPNFQGQHGALGLSDLVQI